MLVFTLVLCFGCLKVYLVDLFFRLLCVVSGSMKFLKSLALISVGTVSSQSILQLQGADTKVIFDQGEADELIVTKETFKNMEVLESTQTSPSKYYFVSSFFFLFCFVETHCLTFFVFCLRWMFHIRFAYSATKR